MLDYWQRVMGLITKQAWLADQTGILQQTLNQWIRKDRLPNVTNGHKIAAVLGVTAEYLVTGNPPAGLTPEGMEIARAAERLNLEGKRAALAAIKGLESIYPNTK
jgi:transcriptional regulator with XRE-family HTH domain